jgi:3-mercaptopyruvate sulfurtransferase SseA
VAYCTVGMRASHLYFVARLLGFQPKLYVGSMADWSPRERLPVVGPHR